MDQTVLTSLIRGKEPQILAIYGVTAFLVLLDLSGVLRSKNDAVSDSFILSILCGYDNNIISGLYVTLSAGIIWYLYKQANNDRYAMSLSFGIIWGSFISYGCILLNITTDSITEKADVTFAWFLFMILFVSFNIAMVMHIQAPMSILTNMFFSGRLPVDAPKRFCQPSVYSDSTSPITIKTGLHSRRVSIDTTQDNILHSRIRELEMQLHQAQMSSKTSDSVITQLKANIANEQSEFQRRNQAMEQTHKEQTDRLKDLLETRTVQLDILTKEKSKFTQTMDAMHENNKSNITRLEEGWNNEKKLLIEKLDDLQCQFSFIKTSSEVVPLLETQVEGLQKEIENLSQELQNVTTHNEQIELNNEQHIKELEIKGIELEQMKIRHEELLEAVKEKVESWKEKETKWNDYTELEDKNNKMSIYIEEMKVKNNKLKEELLNKQNNMIQMSKDFEEKMAITIQKQGESLQAQLDESYNKRIQEEMERIGKKEIKLNEQLVACQLELKSTLDEKIKLNDKSNGYEVTLRDLQSTMEEIQEELKTKTTYLQEIQERNKKLVSSMAAMQQNNNGSEEEFQTALAAKKRLLDEQIGLNNTMKAEITERKEEIKQIIIEKENNEKLYKNATDELKKNLYHEIKKSQDEYNNKLTEISEECDRLQKELQVKITEQDSKRKEIKRLKKELKIISTEQDNKTMELKKENDELKEKTASLEKTLTLAKEADEKKKQKFRSVVDMAKQLQKTCASQEARLKECNCKKAVEIEVIENNKQEE